MCPRAPVPGSLTGTNFTASVAETAGSRVAGGEPWRGARLQEGGNAAEAGARGKAGALLSGN